MTGAPGPGNTHEGPELGQQLRAGREAAGWSRKDLVKMTGISEAKIARIEIKGTGTKEELDAYRSALMGALGSAVGAGSDPPPTPASRGKKTKVETKSPSVSGHMPDGSVRTTHWNGLERGDVVELVGERGKFLFLYHHQYPDDRGGYVELSGPVVRINGFQRGTRVRSINPDRIKFPSKRR